MASILRLFVLLFICCGCGSSFLMVKKLSVDKSSLASTFARTPDPMQGNPPKGEKLHIAWWLPFHTDFQSHKLILQIIYRDLSEETVIKSLPQRVGTFEHALIGREFIKRKGIFSYKVDLIDKEGKLVDSWQHIMWVNVLK